ncbi:hypothetical protein K1719_001351 [Acacia pycnantha]|nr:hypothetical protein K1719_001351 [Acacia pycnantha]
MFGLDYESKKGYIGLDYYGRTVMIKILAAGIHMGQLESVFSQSDTAEKINELKKRYEGKFVILGIDDMDLFKGINLKFSAMGQLLDMHEELRGRVVLVQILNPARSEGKDIPEEGNACFKLKPMGQKVIRGVYTDLEEPLASTSISGVWAHRLN